MARQGARVGLSAAYLGVREEGRTADGWVVIAIHRLVKLTPDMVLAWARHALVEGREQTQMEVNLTSTEGYISVMLAELNLVFGFTCYVRV